MDIFDIFIVYIEWDGGGKRRPALVYKRENGYISFFPITTKFAGKSDAVSSKYFKINDWARSGLDKQSYIDTGSPRRLKETLIENDAVIGRLTDADKLRFLGFLK